MYNNGSYKIIFNRSFKFTKDFLSFSIFRENRESGNISVVSDFIEIEIPPFSKTPDDVNQYFMIKKEDASLIFEDLNRLGIETPIQYSKSEYINFLKSEIEKRDKIIEKLGNLIQNEILIRNKNENNSID